MKSFLLLALAAAALATPALAQDLTLKGPAGQVVTMSAADVAALPHVAVTFDNHGDKRNYIGVPLLDLLAKAGAPASKDIRGVELATVVLVSARDGYQVAIGLAEADPGTRADKVILADRMNGAPIPADSGPFQLVIENDLRPARSAKMVNSIEIRRLGTLQRPAAAH